MILKVIKLHFKDSGRVLYFRTLSDIYKKLSKKELGIGLGALWNHRIRADNPYRNRKVIIEQKDVKRGYQVWIDEGEPIIIQG